MRGELSTRLPDLPDELYRLIEGYSINRYPWYETAAKIYKLESDDILYLKLIEGQPTRTLEQESMILEWIDERVPTPKLLFYGYMEGIEFQLTTEIKGTPIYKVQAHERMEAVKVLGETLWMIHSLDPSGCPIDNRVENKLAKIDDASVLGEAPDERLVFTHGDYCLPNIIIENDVLSGVIDWDYGGLADPYVDFVSCTWSIAHNFGEKDAKHKWIPLFFESYGLYEVNEEKLAFYNGLSDLV
jgi:kanamycin kinase